VNYPSFLSRLAYSLACVTISSIMLLSIMRLQIPNGEIVVNIGNLLAILGGASVRIFVEKLADFFHYAPTCLPLDFGLFFTFP